MATVPQDLKYSKTHEWVRVEGDIGTVGITDHAQAELGDIVYLDLPEVGRILQHDAQFGEIESVKAVSELYALVSGEVVETNTAIVDSTETVNEDPYGNGWLIKVKLANAAELSELLDAASYEQFAEQGSHETVTYISNTPADRAEMLAAIGITTFEELLEPLPESIRLNRDLDLPPALDELALVRHLTELSRRNVDLQSHISFLGAGIYDHFRPAVVSALAGRGEFATAYTPYQPEVSQGILQAMYEYQTLICALTGMDLANASMYDAATGLAEAALMATGLSGRKEVVVLGAVNPHYRQVIETYMAATDHTLRVVCSGDLAADVGETLQSCVGPQTACVIAQQPDFFGCIEDIAAIVDVAHRAGALAILCVDPISLGLLKPPADFDVDIVVGEGQALGNPMGFGGPLLGFFACSRKYVRSFPGRIVGATVDQQGRRGYTMTLRTREQDIRREKATSNICTNQALLALCATIYLCELGKQGLRHVADLCLQKAYYAHQRLTAIDGVQSVAGTRPFFKEFAIRLPIAPEILCAGLLERGIVGGLPLGRYYPDLTDALLVCVTETRTRQDIDRLVADTKQIVEENR